LSGLIPPTQSAPGKNSAARPAELPLVSVVIPTFNRAELVGAAIESVLAQSYRNFEIIVVDDGSTDNTREIVARYPRARYVWQENQERSAARNHGLKLAAGRYIGFLDSDDRYLPHKLEQQVTYLEAHPDAALVHSPVLIADNGQLCRPSRTLAAHEPRGVFWELLRHEYNIFSPAHLIRREAVEAAGGFDADLVINGVEDWDLWLRIAYRHKIAYLVEPTAVYRIHSGNTSQRHAWRAFLRVLQKARGYIAPEDQPLLRQAERALFLNVATARFEKKLRLQGFEFLSHGLLNFGPGFLGKRFFKTAARALWPRHRAGGATRNVTGD
jgi:glycosyltransferase involved in cell wall biosynthesis